MWWYSGWLSRLGPMLAALALLGGCGPAPSLKPTAAPAPPATQAPTLPPAAGDDSAGIQATLDRLAALLADPAGDPAAVAALIDPKHPPLRRVLADYLTATREVADLSPGPMRFTILTTARRGDALVEATVERAWDGRRHTWLFRREGDAWQISQPTEAELGAREAAQIGPFRIQHYAWDAELVEALGPQLQRGLQRMQAVLSIDPATQPVTVTLRPAINAAGFATKGYYRPGATPERDLLDIHTSGYAFGSSDPTERWPESVAKVIIHEYTHRVNDRGVMPIASMPTWMSEGLAEHIAENDHLAVPQFRELVRRGELLSVRDLASPAPDTPRGVLYGYAQSAASYLIETEGIDVFWALAQAYRAAPGSGGERMERALMQALGQTSDQFDQAWQPWLIQRLAAYNSAAT